MLVNHVVTLQSINGIFRDPSNNGTPSRYGNSMGSLPQGGPIIGVPGITLESRVFVVSFLIFSWQDVESFSQMFEPKDFSHGHPLVP